MRIHKIIILIGFITLLSSCVSMSDYRVLKTEFELYKTESSGKQKELERKVETFVNSYNPDLHKELDNNLILAEQYKGRVEKIVSDMEMLSHQIQDLAIASQNDRMVVSENMHTSVAENVVNEFRQLKYNWDKIVSEMNQSIITSRDASTRAQVSAIQAAEKSGAAQKAADIAVETAQNAMKQQAGGPDLQNRLERIEDDIRKIKVMLNPGKDNLSLEMLYNLYKEISKRVGELEKSIKPKAVEVPIKQ